MRVHFGHCEEVEELGANLTWCFVLYISSIYVELGWLSVAGGTGVSVRMCKGGVGIYMGFCFLQRICKLGIVFCLATV